MSRFQRMLTYFCILHGDKAEGRQDTVKEGRGVVGGGGEWGVRVDSERSLKSRDLSNRSSPLTSSKFYIGVLYPDLLCQWTPLDGGVRRRFCADRDDSTPSGETADIPPDSKKPWTTPTDHRMRPGPVRGLPPPPSRNGSNCRLRILPAPCMHTTSFNTEG